MAGFFGDLFGGLKSMASAFGQGLGSAFGRAKQGSSDGAGGFQPTQPDSPFIESSTVRTGPASTKGMKPTLDELENSEPESERTQFLAGKEYHEFSSSNVASSQYDYENNALDVGFKGGGWYRYHDVNPSEAVDFQEAKSKGKWIWDELRVRGTAFGFQKPYSFMSGKSAAFQPKYWENLQHRLEHQGIGPTGLVPDNWQHGAGPYGNTQFAHAEESPFGPHPEGRHFAEGGNVPFYSRLQRAIEGLGNKPIATEALQNRLRKSSEGFSQEEWDWTGMAGFLGDKKSVTREELLKHFIGNQVNVEEVMRHGYDETAKYAEYQTPGRQAGSYTEMLLKLPEYGEAVRNFAMQNDITMMSHAEKAFQSKTGLNASTYPNYQGPHWSESNVLAHMRFNRRLQDRQRIMHIEEIQSDWHQAGRERGYGDKGELQQQYLNYLEQLRKKYGLAEDITNLPNPMVSRLGALVSDQESEELSRSHQATNIVPDAPFKQSWPELAMKRMFHHAASEGYDRITLNSGEQINKILGGPHEPSLPGQQAFYDKMLPNIMGKLAKPFGGKVEPYSLINPDQIKALQAKIDYYSTIGGDDSERARASGYRSSAAQLGLEEAQKGILTSSVALSPEMRESILKRGFPKFAEGGLIPHFAGGTEGLHKLPGPAVHKGLIDYFKNVGEPSKAKLLLEPIGKLDSSDTKSLYKRLFGGKDPELLASALGAPDDAVISYYGDKTAGDREVLGAEVAHPLYKGTQSRTFGIDPKGRKFAENDYFATQGTGSGLGLQVFGKQVDWLQKLGFDKIKTFAARQTPELYEHHENQARFMKIMQDMGKTPREYEKLWPEHLRAQGKKLEDEPWVEQYSGYYTWPRMGYDQPLNKFDPEYAKKAQKQFPDANSVLDIMETEEGRKWWEIHGRGMLSASFDLSKGSRSLDVFENYRMQPQQQEKLAGINEILKGRKYAEGGVLPNWGEIDKGFGWKEGLGALGKPTPQWDAIDAALNWKEGAREEDFPELPLSNILGDFGNYQSKEPYQQRNIPEGKRAFRFGQGTRYAGIHRFAKGGILPLGSGEHMDQDELLAMLQPSQDRLKKMGHFGAKEELERAQLLSSAVESSDIHRLLPKGSEFLGSGLTAFALKAPNKDVYRVQPYADLRPFQDEQRYYHKDLFKYDRPNIPGVLQAKASGKYDEHLIEQLPFAPSLKSMGFAAVPGVMQDKLRKQINEAGYGYEDWHSGNIGLLGGRDEPRIIDPGGLYALDTYQWDPNAKTPPAPLPPEQIATERKWEPPKSWVPWDPNDSNELLNFGKHAKGGHVGMFNRLLNRVKDWRGSTSGAASPVTGTEVKQKHGSGGDDEPVYAKPGDRVIPQFESQMYKDVIDAITGDPGGSPNNKGGLQSFGDPNSKDGQLIYTTPGERIIPGALAAAHAPVLDSITSNRASSNNHFAAGGMVGSLIGTFAGGGGLGAATGPVAAVLGGMKLMGDAAEDVMHIFRATGDTVVQFGAATAKLMGAPDSFIGVMASGGKLLDAWFTSLGEMVVKVINPLKLLDDPLSGFKMEITALKDVVAAVARVFWDMRDPASMLAQSISPFVNQVNKFNPGAVERMNLAFDNLSAAAGRIFEPIIEAAEGFADELNVLYTAIGPDIRSALETLIPIIRDFGREVAIGLTGVVRDAALGLKSLLEDMRPVGQLFGVVFNMGLQAAVQSLSAFVSMVKEGVVSLSGFFGPSLGDAKSQFIQALVSMTAAMITSQRMMQQVMQNPALIANPRELGRRFGATFGNLRNQLLGILGQGNGPLQGQTTPAVQQARFLGIEEVGMEARRAAFSQGRSIAEQQLDVQNNMNNQLALILQLIQNAAGAMNGPVVPNNQGGV